MLIIFPNLIHGSIISAWTTWLRAFTSFESNKLAEKVVHITLQFVYEFLKKPIHVLQSIILKKTNIDCIMHAIGIKCKPKDEIFGKNFPFAKLIK